MGELSEARGRGTMAEIAGMTRPEGMVLPVADERRFRTPFTIFSTVELAWQR